jgi:hypothetical protein
MMIEISIAVVATMATDAVQTETHTGTAKDSRSGTHGEAATTTATKTIADGGGTMEMIDIEEKTDTTVMRTTDGEGTRAAAETADMRADTITTKATINAMTARGGASSVIEATATVCETETSARAVSAAPPPTSAGALRADALPPLLDAHVRIPALVHHPPLPPHLPKTKPSPTLPRLACSRPRRTRSRRQTGRARCSSTTSRLRPASRLLGGGFTFSRAMSKSVRSRRPIYFCAYF